jgi:hypothetical protein
VEFSGEILLITLKHLNMMFQHLRESRVKVKFVVVLCSAAGESSCLKSVAVGKLR